MDARRSQVYNAVYKSENGVLSEIKAPRALALSECIQEFEKDEKVYFLGDGVLAYREEIIIKMGERAVFAPTNSLLQRASSVAELARIKAQSGQTDTYLSLMPVYLRKPQAEREYEEKQGKER